MSDPAPELRVTELAAADRHRLLDQVYDELRILARKILSADRGRNQNHWAAPDFCPRAHAFLRLFRPYHAAGAD